MDSCPPTMGTLLQRPGLTVKSNLYNTGWAATLSPERLQKWGSVNEEGAASVSQDVPPITPPTLARELPLC